VSLFRTLDRDGNGAISRDEFLTGIDEVGLGAAVPAEQRGRIFDIADEQGCGELSYRDFAQHFSPYKATPAINRRLNPELGEDERGALLEEISAGRKSPCSRKVETVVSRLSTPRTRTPRSMRHSASERSLEGMQEERRGAISSQFPYPVRSSSVEDLQWQRRGSAGLITSISEVAFVQQPATGHERNLRNASVSGSYPSSRLAGSSAAPAAGGVRRKGFSAPAPAGAPKSLGAATASPAKCFNRVGSPAAASGHLPHGASGTLSPARATRTPEDPSSGQIRIASPGSAC